MTWAIAAWSLSLAGTVLLLASMRAYPGGSCSVPHASAHDLLRNYFCDLIRPVAHNGEPNDSGMRLGQLGMILTGLSFVPLFVLLPRLFPDYRLGAAIRSFGVLAAVLLPTVACTPSNVHPWWHTGAIAITGLPGSLAIAASAAGILSVRKRYPRLALLTIGVFAASFVTAVLYLVTFIATWPDAWALPTAQKVAWVALIAWSAAATRVASET